MLATALAWPAVHSAPLNVDEETTILIGRRSFGSIFHVVWVERGGGPLHFFLEHGTLAWPGGLVGLRVPSLVFLLLALPAVAFAARALAGTFAAAVATVLFAAAPLATAYGTFGRPHLLLVTWDAWALVVALRAARDGERRWWIGAAVLLGGSILIHPLAPLYAGTTLVAALVFAPRPVRTVAREVWPALLVFALLLVPYYLHTLRVLDRRYVQGSNRHGGRSFSGLPVWEDALRNLAPGRSVVNVFTVLALVGLALLAWRARRSALALAVLVAVPILFFTFVPAKGDAGLFFGRYMLPTLPAFLTLTAAGATAIGLPLARGRLAVWAALLVLLTGAEALKDLRRSDQLARLQLTRVTHAVAGRSSNAVLFATTGPAGPGGYLGSFTFGRPAALLDRYLALRVDGLEVVDDDSCVPAVAFLREPRARIGLWLFYAHNGVERARGVAALRRIDGVRLERLSDTTWAATTRSPAPPRVLLGRGFALRRAWSTAVPRDLRVPFMAAADRQALRDPGACKPRGLLGDPDASAAVTAPKR